MKPIKKVVFVLNDKKPGVIELAQQAAQIFDSYDVEVVRTIFGGFYNTYGFAQEIETISAQKPEVALIFGGDGTIINVAKNAASHNMLILGVNLGTLGFLSIIEQESMADDLAKMFRGEYSVENRLMLNCELVRQGQSMAKYTLVNDLVISNVDIARTIAIDVTIDDEHAMSFKGDGLIVATPNGSTAYSLSAGGSIVCPESRLILLTPICSHNLRVRPMILNGNSSVKIVYQSQNRYARLTMDGQSYMEINSGDMVLISQAEESAGFIWLDKSKFYQIVQNKLFNR